MAATVHVRPWRGSRISMSDRGIAKVSATPAGVGMVGPADRWLLAGARNHRLPYATPSGSIPPDTHLRGAVLSPPPDSSEQPTTRRPLARRFRASVCAGAA